MNRFAISIAVITIIFLMTSLGGYAVASRYPEAIRLYFNLVICPISSAVMLHFFREFDVFLSRLADDEETS